MGAAMLPNFLVIGAMKSGTTSFAHYLGSHPQVFMTKDKEPAFFNRPDSFDGGLEWYSSLFAGAGGALARGEASTDYAKYPRFRGVPEWIAAAVPEMRLLYLVRHPIERCAAAGIEKQRRERGWARIGHDGGPFGGFVKQGGATAPRAYDRD